MDLGEEQGGAFRGAPQRREPALGSGGPPSPFASIPIPQARPDPLLGPPQAFTPPGQIGETPGSSLRERALAAQSPEDFAALLSDDSLFGGVSEGTPIDESPAAAPAPATQQAARPGKATGPKFAEQEPVEQEEMPLISALDHVTRHKPPEPTGRPEYDFELRDIDESEFMDWVKQIEGYKPEVYDDVGAAAGYFGHRFAPGEEFDPNLTPEEHLQVGLTLLDRDMSLARMHAKRAAESIDPDFDFEAAPPSVQYKLMERAYNMGPKFHLHPSSSKEATVKGFPKWTRAVMEGDVETELREFHRRSQGKGLDERNRSYLKMFHRYLSPEQVESMLRIGEKKANVG